MKWILWAVFLVSGVFVYRDYFTVQRASQISFKDVKGQEHGFKPPCKPAVIAFWTAKPSADRDRALAALDLIRGRYPESMLDVVAVYLDRGVDSDVAAQAKASGHTATVAIAQTSENTAQLNAWLKKFKPREPGQDIYVVDAKAGIHPIDASDPKATPTSLEIAVKTAIDASVAP